jgi:AbrB family looped-hinge helix DNA binding protein
MEIRIRDKGRITLPLKVRRLLGVSEGNALILEIKNGNVVLKPKKVVRLKEAKGIARHRVKLEEVEEALGKNEVP